MNKRMYNPKTNKGFIVMKTNCFLFSHEIMSITKNTTVIKNNSIINATISLPAISFIAGVTSILVAVNNMINATIAM